MTCKLHITDRWDPMRMAWTCACGLERVPQAAIDHRRRTAARRPLVAYWTVPRLFPGETVVCLGAGWSLTEDDVAYCRGRVPIVAVNRSYELAPDAEVLYACDGQFWDWHHGAPKYRGLYRVTLDERAAADWGLNLLRKTGEGGLETDPSGLRTGSKGGYSAINLAYHLGASRIVLLGYDACLGPKEEKHWHRDHPVQMSGFDGFLAVLPSILEPLERAGVELVNCSRRTAITCIPRRTLEEVL